MFEPIIKTDISMLPKTIETNLGDLEPLINEKVSLAKSIVVNPDSIEDCEKADADAALLNKMSKRVTQFRLDWTKQWQSPFESVIAKCKDYEKRLAEAAADLHSKSEVGKAKIRNEKQSALNRIFWEKLEAFQPYNQAPWFDRYFSTMVDTKTKGSWMNKGVSPDDAEKQMDEEIARCAKIYDTYCAAVQGDEREAGMEILFDTFDLGEAIKKVNDFREVQKRIAEQKKPEEQKPVVIAPELPIAPVEVSSERVITADRIPLETYRLAITGTRAALVELRKWGEAHGIAFKNLDK